MLDPHTQNALTRLFVTQFRSLPTYLVDADPWFHIGDERAMDTLRHMVADQKAMCGRIADYIVEHGGRVETGEYPMSFTSLNDLSLDYMMRRLAQTQQQDIASLEAAAAELKLDGGLKLDRGAQALADESVGAARAHLEALREFNRLASPSA